MASNENIRLGFLFCNNSFFNRCVSAAYWQRLKDGRDGNFYLQSLAGKLASKNSIVLTSFEVARVVEGGLHLDQQCADGILYGIHCDFVSQTSPASEGVPSSQVDMEEESSHSQDFISSSQSHEIFRDLVNKLSN